MIGLVGLRGNVSISIREKFSISLSKLEKVLRSLNDIFTEVVVLSTCNRTEIYFVTDMNEEEARERIFEIMNWDKKFVEHTFVVKDKKALEHIMKVACGFHSKILGEDQILGQIKDAFDEAVSLHCVKSELQKLFQHAISCGKEFRTVCQLYKIPVSASSIAVKDSIERQVKIFMVIGYGEIGKLAVKYALDSRFTERIYLVVRDIKKVAQDDLIKGNPKIKVINFDEKREFYTDVEAIISCTSAPHTVVKASEFYNIGLKTNLVIYDLAVPRDVEENIKTLPLVELYDIDSLNNINEENKNKRREVMYENIYIVDKYINSYIDWRSIREITPEIEKIKEFSNSIFEERYKVFKNKQNSKAPEDLARMLIKSTSDVYANRAIEVLKEEKLKGREEECLKILERIFFK